MSLTVDGIAATTFTFASVPRTLLSPSFATRLGQPLLGYDWAAFLRDSLLHSGFRLNSRFDAWTFFSYHLPPPSVPPAPATFIDPRHHCPTSIPYYANPISQYGTFLSPVPLMTFVDTHLVPLVSPHPAPTTYCAYAHPQFPTPSYYMPRTFPPNPNVDLIRPLPVYLTLPGILIPHLKLKLKILKLNLFTLLVIPLILYKPVYITVAHPNPPPESGPLPRREFLIPLI
ncbi:hypothetical protein DFH09DRAFT_1335608 [Mycena vulgaris]|nr:hypothetical protein DFH09DRAFT_1335608 [Mycena vulgaris]